jgi:hypothetical protein
MVVRPTEFTTLRKSIPDGKRFFRGAQRRVPSFSKKFHPCVQNQSSIQFIYHQIYKLSEDRYSVDSKDTFGEMSDSGPQSNAAYSLYTESRKEQEAHEHSTIQRSRTAEVFNLTPLHARYFVRRAEWQKVDHELRAEFALPL